MEKARPGCKNGQVRTDPAVLTKEYKEVGNGKTWTNKAICMYGGRSRQGGSVSDWSAPKHGKNEKCVETPKTENVLNETDFRGRRPTGGGSASKSGKTQNCPKRLETAKHQFWATTETLTCYQCYSEMHTRCKEQSQ